MMQEDYVTFEQAKLLEEKGFPQYPSLFYYKTFYEDEEDFSGNIINHFKFNSSEKDIRNKYTVLSNIEYPLINAPTLSLVQKWLRKKKKIWIYPIHKKTSDYNWNYDSDVSYMCKIYNKSEVIMLSDNFYTYEEALSAGINKVLELI